MAILLLVHSTALGVTWEGIPDNVGFTACQQEMSAVEPETGVRSDSLAGLLQQVERIQLDEEQKERLAFLHLACFPGLSSKLPDRAVARPIAMKLISNYYATFRAGFSTERHAEHASNIDN